MAQYLLAFGCARQLSLAGRVDVIMANQNEVTPVNAGPISPAVSSFFSPESGAETLVQHFHVSPEKMQAIELILQGESGLANAPPGRRPVAKKSKHGGLVDFLAATAKILVLSSVVVAGPQLAKHHHSHHGPGHAGHPAVRRTTGRRQEKAESGNLESGNELPVQTDGVAAATPYLGETFNREPSTPNAELKEKAESGKRESGNDLQTGGGDGGSATGNRLTGVGGGVAMESIFVRGRFKYLAGCSEVWFDGVHFDLRKRHTARLCLDYLTGQNAWDELSARHLETEIDPQVRQQCQYPRPAEIRIHHYFKDECGRLAALRDKLVVAAGKNGKFFLKTI